MERNIYETRLTNVLIITEARMIGGGVPYITGKRINLVFHFLSNIAIKESLTGELRTN